MRGKGNHEARKNNKAVREDGNRLRELYRRYTLAILDSVQEVGFSLRGLAWCESQWHTWPDAQLEGEGLY
jgi:hypothetical protein